ARDGLGCICFSPLSQGLLTNRYLNGIPEGSRAAAAHSFLSKDAVAEALPRVTALNAIAARRGQTLAAMAIAWILRDPRVTSALVGGVHVTLTDD
ncbi:MAG: aldo/keto reductase, partial [Cellulomonadaceae bacterium]|nr:aldo/keto reductase [Cellulomonadaceae bacterium]